MVIICVTGPVSSGRHTVATLIQKLDSACELMTIESSLSDSTVKSLYNHYNCNIVVYPLEDLSLFHRLNKRSTVLLVQVSTPINQRLLNHN